MKFIISIIIASISSSCFADHFELNFSAYLSVGKYGNFESNVRVRQVGGSGLDSAEIYNYRFPDKALKETMERNFFNRMPFSGVSLNCKASGALISDGIVEVWTISECSSDGKQVYPIAAEATNDSDRSVIKDIDNTSSPHERKSESTQQ